MTKEEAVNELHELRQTLNDHRDHMTKMCESLKLAANGDVTMSCLDDIRATLEGMAEARKKVERAKSVVKARILARVKD